MWDVQMRLLLWIWYMWPPAGYLFKASFSLKICVHNQSNIHWRAYKYLCSSSLGLTMLASPPIDFIAVWTSGNAPAAQAPRIAAPIRTDSLSLGHSIGRFATSAWVWTNNGLWLRPPHTNSDWMFEWLVECSTSMMCSVPYWNIKNAHMVSQWSRFYKTWYIKDKTLYNILTQSFRTTNIIASKEYHKNMNPKNCVSQRMPGWQWKQF